MSDTIASATRYSPDQRRAPKGASNGGKWVAGGGDEKMKAEFSAHLQARVDEALDSESPRRKEFRDYVLGELGGMKRKDARSWWPQLMSKTVDPLSKAVLIEKPLMTIMQHAGSADDPFTGASPKIQWAHDRLLKLKSDEFADLVSYLGTRSPQRQGDAEMASEDLAFWLQVHDQKKSKRGSDSGGILTALRDGLRSIGETIAAYLDGDLAAERALPVTPAIEGPSDNVDAGPWIVAARVEGDEARHLAGGPLTAQRLEATADSYDPAYRRAPVLLSHNEGSAPVVGYVEELDFDGLNLMARVSEIEPDQDGTGRLTRAVADGWRQRSVKIALREPGLEGNPPYLYHLALLSAQQPGTPDLPHLDSTFLRSDSETETVTRAILDDVEPTATQEDEMTQEDLTRAVTDAVAPLASRIDQLQTELAATRSQLDEARAASDTATADARRAALESTVTELVTAGRVSPAEQELELEALLALPEDKAALRVAAIRNRPAFLVRRGATRLTAAVETLPTMAQRVAEVGDVPVRMDPEALRVLAEAERDAAGDEAKLRELIYRAHGEPCPATARA